MARRIVDADLILDSPQLRAERERVTRGVLGAGKRAVSRATRGLEQALEETTREHSRGNLWRAWQSEVYPRTGVAREPAGIVFLKGRDRTHGAIEFLTRPGRIKPKDGGFLAIPTPAAAGGSRHFGGGRNREQVTPAQWERRTGLKLRFVYRRGRPSLLVLDEGRLSGKRQIARLASQRARERGNTATIVIFVLLPLVPFANRFGIDPVVRRYGGRIDEYFQTELGRLSSSRDQV